MIKLKDNYEKQVKIIGIGVMLGGLALLILDIYYIYCFGFFQGLLDMYFLFFGLLLLIAGLGLVKFRSWAHKMMLYIMALYFLAGLYELLSWIMIVLSISTDYRLFIYAIIVFLIMFVILIILPTIGVFCLLNRKEIKDLFQRK